MHYDEDGRSEWACGGDSDCEAVEQEPDCVPGFSHKWTNHGMGGLDSNPGVWSLGGTKYQFESRCVLCGVERTEIHYGSQRNPGECDSTSYEPKACRWSTIEIVDTDEARTEAARQRRNRRRRERKQERKQSLNAT